MLTGQMSLKPVARNRWRSAREVLVFRGRRSIADRLGIHCLALCLLLGLVAPTAQAASAPAMPPIISLLLSGEIPAVGITSPVSGSTLVAGDITVSAYAADADGTISKVEFFVGGTTLIGTATSAPYSITWPKVAPGQYTLSAKATDNDGETGLSAPVSITVSATVSWQIYFVHTDHLNTPRLIANSAGQTVWTWANDDPFGNNVPNENPSGLGNFTCNLRFPGQYFDKETNLHYNYFRDYDPAIGRYIQSDPIGLDGGINTYSYGESNPLSLIDPLGLWAWGDPLDQDLVNAITGFGDAFLLPELMRNAFGISGGLEQCSAAYRYGKVAGFLTGSAPFALRGAAALGGTRLGNSVFNSNRYFRIGPGRMPSAGPNLPPGPSVPRMVVGPTRPGNAPPHVDLRSRLPYVPPIGGTGCDCQ